MSIGERPDDADRIEEILKQSKEHGERSAVTGYREVDESVVETVAEHIATRLDQTYGDTVSFNRSSSLVESDEISPTEIGRAFRELEEEPRYGVETELVNPGCDLPSWVARRSEGSR